MEKQSVTEEQRPRVKAGYIAVFVLVVLAGNFELTTAGSATVCSKEDLSLTCGPGEVIVMTSAEFGRKEVGRCIPEADEFMGCVNEALPVVDRWCSGRQSCQVERPNDYFEEINTECRAILKTYMEADFDCVKVQKCSHLHKKEGFISSHVTNTAGCGSPRSPWVISADPGQTVNITMLDFAAAPEDGSVVTCRNVYGYILERALGINHTICGGSGREVALYASKTNTAEIHISMETADVHFLLHYVAIGCQDLSPPANAWYKREGSEALIGCETNDQQWRLTCTGSTWHGTVGNCSKGDSIHDVVTSREKGGKSGASLTVPSIITMTGICGGALVAIVIAVMAGVISVKKYRMKQETKKIQMTYPTMDKHSQAYYRPVSTGQPTTFGKVPDNMSGSWEMTFPPRADTTTSYPAPCACSTFPYRPDANHARSMSAASSDGATYETPKFVDNTPLTNS